ASSHNDIARIRNENIGFVFQSFHLLPRLSALKNVELPLLYRGMGAEARRSTATAWLQRVGMADRLRHKPNELSGGQRQRVAIARALVGSPGLILADEPTGALDAQTGQEIMNLFIELNLSEGVTVIIITHDAQVGSVCRRQLILENGLLLSKTAGNI
ncbi:MAG: ATP-binding cassette domain-containing protein, partial [Gammaproteobacteria bacterium]|nr:ATP-binding cassette domain-containing protein [Gammaproteobacteria bacterium]